MFRGVRLRRTPLDEDAESELAFSTRAGRHREPVFSNHLLVPERAILENTLLALIIHPDDAKALRVAEAPFEVVHQRPNEIASQGHTTFNGSMGSHKMVT